MKMKEYAQSIVDDANKQIREINEFAYSTGDPAFIATIRPLEIKAVIDGSISLLKSIGMPIEDILKIEWGGSDESL